MKIKNIFSETTHHHTTLSSGMVIPEDDRCVQCGICSYYCPIGIDVRTHVWKKKPVQDRHCLTCGECVARCPRGVLRFGRIKNLSEIRN